MRRHYLMFLYALGVWMFHCPKLNNCIKYIYERVSRIPFGNNESLFDQLLLQDNFFKNHHRNLQKLTI